MPDRPTLIRLVANTKPRSNARAKYLTQLQAETLRTLRGDVPNEDYVIIVRTRRGPFDDLVDMLDAAKKAVGLQ